MSSELLNLRRAEEKDAEALLALIDSLADFEKLPRPDAEARRRLLEHGFGPRPRFETWLVGPRDEEQPAGYAIFLETYSTFLAKPTLYIEDLYVKPEYRRRGYGGALLAKARALASERGCGRIEWTCLDWNTKAQAVYEGLGAKRMSEWLLYRQTDF
ncbi:GNAT family N-acetyltransferase [Nibricoccus sp. IMCC34717]|uniref:GNAT family N-acetyltransferase n=1 Tax=Nibricoccus sp. IMCC34717 TaxID=3034021 RepID=UPI00384B19E7